MAKYESKSNKFDCHSALEFLAEAGQGFARMADDLAKIKLPKDQQGRILGIKNLARRMGSLAQEMEELYEIINHL